MRKRNLKLTLNIVPSQGYLRAVIAAHTLSSFASFWLPLTIPIHLLFIGAIATSLCHHLKLYTSLSGLIQIRLEGRFIQTKRQGSSVAHQDEVGELLPSVWILPGLCVLYAQVSGRKKMLPIFADGVTQDDFRRLRIFALRGPLLLHKDADENAARQDDKSIF